MKVDTFVFWSVVYMVWIIFTTKTCIHNLKRKENHIGKQQVSGAGMEHHPFFPYCDWGSIAESCSETRQGPLMLFWPSAQQPYQNLLYKTSGRAERAVLQGHHGGLWQSCSRGLDRTARCCPLGITLAGIVWINVVPQNQPCFTPLESRWHGF